MKDDIELNLFENALDSLIYGLNSYESALNDPHKNKLFKYSLLIMSLYVELSFKYFVSRIEPNLIYSDIYKRKLVNLDTEKTISFNEAICIIKNSRTYDHLELDNYADALNWLKLTANRIKHNQVKINKNDIKNKVGKILFILNEFYNANNIFIVDEIQNRDGILTKTFYTKVIDDYEHAMLHALNEASVKADKFIPKMKHELPSISIKDARQNCPSCGANTYILNDETMKYCCTFCKETDEAFICHNCGSFSPMDELYEKMDLDDDCSIYWCSDDCYKNTLKQKGCD